MVPSVQTWKNGSVQNLDASETTYVPHSDCCTIW